jgi:hypothetical protein
MKTIDEKELRKQKALEARQRALERMQQKTDKLVVKLRVCRIGSWISFFYLRFGCLV